MLLKKLRYSCDNCTLKKRKCDRKNPCTYCSNKGLKCVYSQQKEIEEKLSSMELRIEQMEQNLLVPDRINLEKKERIIPLPLQVNLSNELEKELFTKNHDYLLDLRFKKFPCITTGIPEQFYRQSAKQFWPLRFALYSSGAMFIREDQLPQGIANRIELSKIFLQKAQSFNFATVCDHISVVALSTIATNCYHLNSVKEALVYYRLALQYAKSSNINTEEGISKLSHFDYERECIRRIWWLIYTNYTVFSKHIGYGTIKDEENQIFLPANRFYFESATSLDYFAVEIITSDEWYTVSLPNQSVEAYGILLLRIQSKIRYYVEIELSQKIPNLPYIAGTINSSLNEWMDAFSGKLQEAIHIITNRIPRNLDLSWLTVYGACIYNSNRINLMLPKFMKNVIKGKNVLHQLYFKEALDAALSNAQVVSLLLRYNPQLEYFTSVGLLTLFPCAFFLLCCTKIGNFAVESINSAYKLHLEGLNQFRLAFQKLNQFYNILLHLQSKDLLETIIYYGIFTGRRMDELMERPAASHVELLENLNINK
ncbi:hypothetical protein HDV06_005193 [Boothiomyces sp. JEL0866]|nr:hypothetical protein HDV06_005193 [Boothiomyces sp. JEL0866]